MITGRMIFAGGKGGGLDLTVVGGTTQPTAPVNNTIWVNTSTTINDVYLSPTVPASPATGDVWIDTSVRYGGNSSAVTSTKSISVCDAPFLEINVFQLNQWDGSTWVYHDGGVYANNTWTDMALYIYDHGAENALHPLYAIGATDINSNWGYVGTEWDISRDADSFTVVAGTGWAYVVVTVRPEGMFDASLFSQVGISYFTNGRTGNYCEMNAGFTTSEEQYISYNTAQNGGYLTMSNSTEETLITIPITITGVVRPTIAIRNGNTKYVNQITVKYWVLT